MEMDIKFQVYDAGHHFF